MELSLRCTMCSDLEMKRKKYQNLQLLSIETQSLSKMNGWKLNKHFKVDEILSIRELSLKLVFEYLIFIIYLS